MIHELRTYTLQPGAQAKYLQLSGEVGRKIRGDRFGKQEGFWFTEFGTLNQLVHLWSFPDLNERERLRGLLAKDDAWNKEYIPQVRPLMLAQENKIMSPVLPLNPTPDPCCNKENQYCCRNPAAQIALGQNANYQGDCQCRHST